MQQRAKENAEGHADFHAVKPVNGTGKYSYARNNPIVNKDPNGHGLIGELGEIGLRMIEARNAPYTVFGSYYSTYGNPNVPVSQHIGAAIDVGIPAVLLLTPSLSPVAGVVGIWEAFVFSGEVITGRDLSESAEYVEGLKERAANGWSIPGYNFAPSLRPSSSGSSYGPMPGASAQFGGNGRPQPQNAASGGPSGARGSGGSSSMSFAQQVASIQAQIASIQAQINAYVQSTSQRR
jgi:hypothetical protein